MLNWSFYTDSFSTERMREIWSEDSAVQSWLDVEHTLAQCQADLGIIPDEAAKAIGRVSPSQIDRLQLLRDMNIVGRPIVGLVKQLSSLVGPTYSEYVHFKATTQDVMDTAMVMQMKLGLSCIIQQLDQTFQLINSIAESQPETRMIGRTNGQFAMPIHFRTKLSVWSSELSRRKDAISEASKRGLLVQMGGPVGDLSQYEESSGKRLKDSVANATGLGKADPHWQNSRDGVADIVTALGALCASLCKITHNVNILSSSDVNELSEKVEAGKGASSSMAHKRNQRASEFGEAVARLGRQRSEQINELTLHEHERSGGAWIAEWLVVPEVFILTSGALMWSARLFENLQVNQDVMLANIVRFKDQMPASSISHEF